MCACGGRRRPETITTAQAQQRHDERTAAQLISDAEAYLQSAAAAIGNANSDSTRR